MYSKLVSWSRGVYLAGIVLALVLVVPAAWFPFQLAKITIFALFLLIATGLFVAGGGVREVLRTHGFFGALLVALLPLTYLLSFLFSTDKSVGVMGLGVETDTVLFTTLLFLAFMLSFTLFRTLRTVRQLNTVLFWALIAAALFQFVSIIFGNTVIPFETFADRSVNLVGKWNDLGLLLGLLLMLCISRAELMSITNLWRIITALLSVALIVLLGIINFSLVWILLLVFSLVLVVVKFMLQRSVEGESAAMPLARRLPYFALGVAILSVLFLFLGSTLNAQLTSFFPVSSLEVRPSYASTLDVITKARAGSLSRVMIGTGPNTFTGAWIAYRPAEVNSSAFWNLDFNVGFSTLITALGTVGLLGVLAWLTPLLLVLAALLRALRLGVLNREDKLLATTLGISSIFLLLTLLLYVPSQNIILLSFVMAGLTFGFLWRQGQSALEESPESYLGQMVRYVAAALFIVLACWSTFSTSRRFIAEAYVGKGALALSEGSVDEALGHANRALSIERVGDALRLLMSVDATKLQQLANSDRASSPEVQQEFAALVQQAINAGQEAGRLNPRDYRPTFALGQIYDYLAALRVQGAANTALTTYQSAQAQAPTNPSIPLAIARLAAREGDATATSNYLSQALTLKPNFTDAILLVVQLNVAQNDIPNAIRAATAATQSAPGVGPIWFQLGLLYYSAGDAANAVTALERAVSIVPDYANAKYFLGLSYNILNRRDAAITQFRDLERSNPDNQEVKLILSNLESGKQPFEGAQPPVTSTPQERTTAPVSE